jgi:hypothetical protein
VPRRGLVDWACDGLRFPTCKNLCYSNLIRECLPRRSSCRLCVASLACGSTSTRTCTLSPSTMCILHTSNYCFSRVTGHQEITTALFGNQSSSRQSKMCEPYALTSTANPTESIPVAVDVLQIPSTKYPAVMVPSTSGGSYTCTPTVT